MKSNAIRLHRPLVQKAGLRRHMAGFSMVEILVGLGIGMIGMVVMLQVFGLSEGYKRNTTSGDDAQTGGAIAMYSIQRDLRQSGHGITTANVLGCSLQLRTGVTLNALAPVVINPPNNVVPAGDSSTDTLLVFIGSGVGAPEGDRLTGHLTQSSYRMSVSTLFVANDYVIAAPATSTLPCARIMEPVLNVVAPNVNVATGVAGIVTNDWLLNVGRSPKVQAYAIRGGRLTMCNYMTNNCGSASTTDENIWVPIADNVVSLRAQYVKDTNGDSVADTYNQSTPPDGSAATLWSQIIGVRMVLVARSAQYDKTEVTPNVLQWSGSSSSPAVPISLSSFTDWKHYRYKVFETLVPIRNQ